MRLEVIDIEKLRSNSGQIEGLPANPRKWDADDVKRLAKSIEETPELLEAAGKISMHGYMSDEDKVNVLDEASDMCAVHISTT